MAPSATTSRRRTTRQAYIGTAKYRLTRTQGLGIIACLSSKATGEDPKGDHRAAPDHDVS